LMDRNLDASQVAASLTDSLAYGGLYQWGRGADGHQFDPGSAQNTTTSSSDSPGHSDFIITGTSPYDWRIPQNNNLWQGESGINNPCPAGFRIPTKDEWEAEIASWNSLNASAAFASPLKLVLGGYHCHYCGNYFDDGTIGYYWSSTIFTTVHDGNFSHYLRISPEYQLPDGTTVPGTASMNTDEGHHAYGYSVRCIQD